VLFAMAISIKGMNEGMGVIKDVLLLLLSDINQNTFLLACLLAFAFALFKYDHGSCNQYNNK
jgi:hypothetical protein